MRGIIQDTVRDSQSVQSAFFSENADAVVEAADRLSACLASGHKILIFGNGGSAADSQHFAAELVNRFTIERHPLPAISLTTDTSVLTSIGNDYSFDEIFSKQVAALGKKHDAAVGISTSGSSPNVLRGIEAATAAGMFSVGLCGRGGELASKADMAFRVESDSTARIQEVHGMLIHVLCDLIERTLFPLSFPSA